MKDKPSADCEHSEHLLSRDRVVFLLSLLRKQFPDVAINLNGHDIAQHARVTERDSTIAELEAEVTRLEMILSVIETKVEPDYVARVATLEAENERLRNTINDATLLLWELVRTKKLAIVHHDKAVGILAALDNPDGKDGDDAKPKDIPQDIFTCPKCGGPADQGFSRELPPAPYYCTKCQSVE